MEQEQEQAGKTRTVHFTVDGDFITHTAREILLSDSPGQAYRLIANGLGGEGIAEAAIKVLAGTHDLIGNSTDGIELVEAEDTPELRRFKKDFAYIYAGRHRGPEGWRRPCAVVTSFNEEDARFAFGVTGLKGVPLTLPEQRGMLLQWCKARVEYYCSRTETVSAARFPGRVNDVNVIWEPCGELPHWMRPNVTLDDALKDFLDAGRDLEKRKRDRPFEKEEADLNGKKWAESAEDKEERKKEEARQEEEYARKDREHKAECLDIGERVRAQADGDNFELKLEDGSILAVPRAPFMQWALRRTDERDQAPEWLCVSRSGMKMAMDDPYHTDWVLGAGISLEDAYKENIKEAAYSEMFRLQGVARGDAPDDPDEPDDSDAPDALDELNEFSGLHAALQMLKDTVHKAGIIVNAGVVEGTVGVDIAVYPDSEPARAVTLGGIKGVVVEKGGKIAHFAIVSRGKGITVMHHPDACELFSEGMKLSLNPKTGKIIVLDEEE